MVADAKYKYAETTAVATDADHSPLSTGGSIFILTILVNMKTILVDMENKRRRRTEMADAILESTRCVLPENHLSFVSRVACTTRDVAYARRTKRHRTDQKDVTYGA
jgi:hypothetical protein